MDSNPPVCRLRNHVLSACFAWITFCLIVWQLNCFQIGTFHLPAPKPFSRKNYSSPVSVFDMGISDEEWERLQKALNWPGPDQLITQLNLTTSPVHSTFSVVEPKNSYKVGENISVIIIYIYIYWGYPSLQNKQVINILPNTAGIGKTEKCRSGLTTPVPAGFYFKDVWTSFVCNTQQFNSSKMWNCLQNKIVYMMGDSTTRQWFEFFENKVPGIKRMDLHTPRLAGPLMAVELKNNIIIHWRPHGVPLRFTIMPMTDLHYIANDIDKIAGGPHVVVVFTLFAHLVFHPITFYVHKVAKIRQSVVALLSRAPETTVIIKSGNTAGLKDIFQSDWYAVQENIVMKEMFRDIDGVIYFDVWQMTSCHYLTENVHPGPVVIANEINMFLSYVCPA
ncbi:NXPE family member 3-like [Puntigrus tetrazona]|uniref:NXPE family member 3-like n=1 Tax=Puntigrus tetrazona TaxID=1606681 RepID=UPI001C89AFC3|nr:NXPE family member 3-like [Puntigrus tetrazona]